MQYTWVCYAIYSFTICSSVSKSHRGDALLDYVGSGVSMGRNQFEGYFFVITCL